MAQSVIELRIKVYGCVCLQIKSAKMSSTVNENLTHSQCLACQIKLLLVFIFAKWWYVLLRPSKALAAAVYVGALLKDKFYLG